MKLGKARSNGAELFFVYYPSDYSWNDWGWSCLLSASATTLDVGIALCDRAAMFIFSQKPASKL
ncbi:MAG: hypothetical protein EBW38_12325 [Rhodobacteraceae bacterium]|nr:hypothetical protein [Paracoccaceae bacterium]